MPGLGSKYKLSQYKLPLIPIISQFNEVQFECTYTEQGYQHMLIYLL